ncbi:MAG: hypothetical protein Q7T69_08180 [Rhodoferax sp.]|nr:hypothetical protein [Rhodoferax sp.]
MNLIDWKVESLRKTFIFHPTQALDVTDLWKKIFGTEPNDRTDKPLNRTTHESGEWNGLNLQLTCQPGRIDLLLSGSISEQPLPDGGNFEIVSKDFGKLTLPAGVGAPVRVAFGAVCFIEKQNHDDCYVTLRELLPHVEIGADSQEFFYRINNRKKATFDASRLNCISAWHAVRSQTLNITSGAPIVTEAFAVRAELDLSTAAEMNLPPEMESIAVFEELQAIANELFTKGPRP